MNSSSSKSNKLGGQQYYHQEKHYKNAEQEDSNSSLENKSKGGNSNKYKRNQVEIKLFVGQIPKTWEENDLKTFFEKYGEVGKVQVIRDKNNQHKGCAFVVFASILCANIAIEALKATKLPGMQNNIQVKWADNEPDRLGIRQDQDYVLYVAHIPKSASEPEIRNVFEKYGMVKEVDIPKDQSGNSRGYVFVKFDNIEQAILAKQALHEKQVLNNQTQSLVVKFYDPKKKQGQGNTGPQQTQSGPSSNNYNSNGQGQSHHQNRDNQGQSGYFPQSSQSSNYQQGQGQLNQRGSDNYNYQRDQHSNYNQGNQQSGYRGGQGNYHGHHDSKPYNQNNQNYSRENNSNLNNSEHYEQPSQSFDSFQSHSSNFREQYGNQNLHQSQHNSFPHQNRNHNNNNSNSNNSSNNNNNNFQYSSSYPSNQPAGNNLNNQQFNQTYNNHSNDYNFQNQSQNEYIPPAQGQNNFQFNEYQQPHHNNNSGPLPNNTNNNQIQQFNPYYNNENFDNYNNPQQAHNEQQPVFNPNQPPQQQQIPQQQQHEISQPQLFNLPQQQPVNPSPSLDVSQPSSSNYQDSIPPVEPTQQPIQQKAFIKYYTEDKVPYYYDTQNQSTSYDQPPLGSIIYNPDGTQEHVQPESIEQLQKFQQETGITENKELEILSQKTTGPPGANLFIFHLPNDYRDSDLLRLFKKFGDLLSARVITRPDGSSKGYGFVSYTHPDGAQQAIQQMNGLQVGKKKLKVEVKKGQGDGDLPPGLTQNGYQPF